MNGRARPASLLASALVLLPACGASVGPAPSPTDAAPGEVAPDRPADVVAPPDVVVDASAEAGGDAGPDGAPACPLPAVAAACAADDECATVARGCYCGRQPVNGVNRSFATAAAACEDQAARSCALGCANFPGQVAQDGRSPADGGTIATRCARDGGAGTCQTFVP